jgi:hypothetical protein
MSEGERLDAQPAQADAEGSDDHLQALLRAGRPAPPAEPFPSAVVGELVGLAGSECTPLVIYPGQPAGAALPARSTIDLHGGHVGQQVLLVFERGDPQRPILTGLLRPALAWPLADPPGQVEIDAGGERLLVSATKQLVLRCGKASITLTDCGKVLIAGAYVSSRASGVNRIKGGSVQLN